MPLDERELRARCQSAAETHIASLLEGSYEVIPGEAESSWDSFLHRQVFTQSFVIWHNRKDVQIEITPEGTVRSFRDATRFDHAKYEPLDPAEVLEICRTTGRLSSDAQVQSAQQAPAEMLAAVILDIANGKRVRGRFLINCVSRQVAAFDLSEEKS